jgi:predicted ester cyclase
MHSSVSGTHTGPFMGIPPIGSTFSDVHHIYIFTFRDGKIAEYRAVRDDIAMMRQLGTIPNPSAA